MKKRSVKAVEMKRSIRDAHYEQFKPSTAKKAVKRRLNWNNSRKSGARKTRRGQTETGGNHP